MERSKLPSREQLQGERKRLAGRRSFRHSLASAMGAVIVAAAAAVLLSMLVFPVYKISGRSMEPGLQDGDVVLCIRQREYSSGQVCGVSLGSKLLMKRIVAQSGDTVTYDELGNVTVNGNLLNEPYIRQAVEEKPGEVNVPDGSCFIMGDNRGDSIDSRSPGIGPVQQEDILCRAVLRIMPFDRFGLIE